MIGGVCVCVCACVCVCVMYVCTLISPDVPDPIHVDRGDTGKHPKPAITGTTRLATNGDIHEEEPEPYAIIVTPTHIHFAELRNDPLFCALRERATLAVEDGRRIQ